MSIDRARPEAPASAAAEPRTRRRWWRLAATVLVCVFAWSWLVRNADLRALAQQVGEVGPWAWMSAGLALLAGHTARAFRLQAEWRHLRAVPLSQCLRLVLLHNAAVVMLPLRSGEAGYLWLVRRQWAVGWRAAALSLLRWRMQDATVLGLLALMLLAPVSLPARFSLVLAACLAVGWMLPLVWRRLTVSATGDGMPGGRSVWRGAGAAVALWSLKVLANGGLLAALAGLPLDLAARAALGGELAGVQPLQPPAGLGVYEAGVCLAAGEACSRAAHLVTAALAVHAFSLCIALGAAAVAQLTLAPAGFVRKEES